MSKHEVKFSRKANAQIRKIVAYIAQDDVNAALKMVDRIESRINRLADNPLMGVELPQEDYPFIVPGYRRLVVNPFLVYYRVIEQTMFITHVVHERRNRLTD